MQSSLLYIPQKLDRIRGVFSPEFGNLCCKYATHNIDFRQEIEQKQHWLCALEMTEFLQNIFRTGRTL